MTVRKISNEELADLSSNWENVTVDTSKYYQNVMVAFEVSEEVYKEMKAEGFLCQKYNNKFYVA